ncbi:MAG: S8 family serine peptidase [Myxococcota bacterium]
MWSLLTWTIALAAPTLPREPLAAEALYANPGAEAVVVKWRDGARARVGSAGDLRFEGIVDDGSRAEVERLLGGHRLAPWIALSEGRLAALERRAESRSGRAQPDLAGIHRIELDDPTPDQLLALGRALQPLDLVEFVAIAHADVPPPVDYPPTTADHEGAQGYLGPDPGFDVHYAWSEGLTGAGVTVRDCEYGWDAQHEDLVDGSLVPEPNQTPSSFIFDNGWHEHGTAVAGIVVGQDNGYGVTGIAPSAGFGMYPENTVQEGARRSTAVANALADSAPGDIVLLEMQTSGPDGNLGPAELNAAVWTVVRTGVDAGITVFAAAGNGAADLDSDPYLDYRMRGDSGAIVVGASSPDATHARMDFSTFGARVDVQAWGTDVFTAGYGEFVIYGGDSRQSYTDDFGGTSSASALISGVTALLMEASFAYRSDGIGPVDLRDLMKSSGQPSSPGIGSFPDLRAALQAMDGLLDVPPAILPAVLPGDPPGRIAEGAWVELTVAYAILPVHTARVVWTEPDGATFEGETLRFRGADDSVVDIGVEVFDEFGRSATDTFRLEIVNVPPTLTGPIDVVGERLENGPVGLAVTASDPGADTIDYRWTVEGTRLETTAAEAEVVLAEGTHTIEVVAVDDDGGVSDAEQVVVIVADVPASLVIDAPSVAVARDAVALEVAILDPGLDDVHSVLWEFGDGETAEGATTQHAWTEPGVYPFAVTVTDDKGVVVVERATVTVEPGALWSCSTPATPPWVLGGLLVAALARRRRRTSIHSRSISPRSPS